jgi:hypothetical protein
MKKHPHRNQGAEASVIKPVTSRFVQLSDLHERWTVWDRDARMPAVFGREACIGLSRKAADEMCKILIEVHGASIPWTWEKT